MTAPRPTSSTRRLGIAAEIAAVALYLAIAIAYGRTRAPYVDEAWFAMPAWNLAEHGSFGTPVIEPSGSPLPGIDVKLSRIRSHTYWNLPLPMVVEAGWFRALGFSIASLRLFSTLWSLVLLGAWYAIMGRLSGSVRVAALSVLLTAADPVFLERSGFGRFDLMSAALGLVGIAAYLALRERSLGKALLAGHAGVAAAGMTHPTGGILSLAGLVCLTIFYDRRRLRWVHLALVAAPYLAAAAGMAVYIVQDAAAFRDQFFGITGSRLAGIRTPVSLAVREALRFLHVYGLNPGGSKLSRLKVLILAAYACGAGRLLLRAETRKRYRGLMLLTTAYLGTLTVFDALKQQWYVVYLIPMFAALLAAALCELRPQWRRWAAASVAALCLADVASVVRLIASDRYDREYRPLVAYLNAHAGPHSIVVGSSEIALGYGLDRNLVDDIRLGCRTGKPPDLLVVETRYREAFQFFGKAEPETAQCIARFFQRAAPPVAFGSDYDVYAAPVSGPGR